MNRLIRMLKKITPPVLWDLILIIRRASSRAKQTTGEQRDSSWYDCVFLKSDKYKLRYSDTPYYAMWCVMADRLHVNRVERILDVGCGPGQFAQLLRDRGFQHYRGIDFSDAQIQHAKKECSEFDFETQDAFTIDFDSLAAGYAIICTEVLEHLDDDCLLLERLPSGSYVLFSVPNFPSAGHVRHFESSDDVVERYAMFFEKLEVIKFNVPHSEHGVLFLGIGVRAS